MVAVKEKHFKSVKTDASLYNGQPTDKSSDEVKFTWIMQRC